MADRSTLCVSVQAGENLLSGPDWIKIEDSKTLIDVLVEVSGTQALGYQVQVVVSKEPSFTEAALVQVLNLVSMLRDSGSIYVKFLLKSSVLPSKQRYDESKCKAERDTDLSPFESFHEQVKEKPKDDDIYSIINATFDKPFESNYLNKLFSEQKLPPATLSSLKDELTRKHLHKETDNFTTWSQQSRFGSKNEGVDINASSCSSNEQSLTDWTKNDCTELQESIGDEKHSMDHDEIMKQVCIKSIGDHHEPDDNQKEKESNSQRDQNAIVVENKNKQTTKDQMVLAGQDKEGQKTLTKRKDGGKKSIMGNTPLPKTNRSMTLRTKKNAVACPGVQKKEKKDFSKSGMPILCKKISCRTPNTVPDTKTKGGIGKNKERKSPNAPIKDQALVGISAQRLNKTQGSVPKKSAVRVEAIAKNEKVRSKISSSRNITTLQKDRNKIGKNDVKQKDQCTKEGQHAVKVGNGVGREVGESVKDQPAGQEPERGRNERTLENTSISQNIRSSIAEEQCGSYEKSSHISAVKERELSISNDSGYDVTKDFQDSIDTGNCSLEVETSTSNIQCNAEDFVSENENNHADHNLVGCEEARDVSHAEPSKTGGSSIIQHTQEDSKRDMLNVSSHCSIGSMTDVSKRIRPVQEPFQFLREEGHCVDELQTTVCQIEPVNALSKEMNSDVQLQRINGSNESDSVRTFVSENSSNVPAPTKNSTEQGHNSSLLSCDSCSREDGSSQTNYISQKPFEKYPDVQSIGTPEQNKAALFVNLPEDTSQRRLKSSFDSLDIVDSSEMQRKTSINFDYGVRRSESLGRDTCSPVHKKSGFFHQLKEKTIDLDSCVLLPNKLEHFFPMTREARNMNENPGTLLLNMNVETQSLPVKSERKLLNVTIDKIHIDGTALRPNEIESETSAKKSPTFLGETGRDAVANRTFSLDEENDTAIAHSSEKTEESSVMKVKVQQKDDLDEAIAKEAYVSDNTAEESQTPSEINFADKDHDKSCIGSEFGKDIECHVRRTWATNQGIMDQLLLTSLCDLSCDLNASAERILNKIRYGNDQSNMHQPIEGLSRISHTNESKNQNDGGTVQLFQGLRLLEKQLNEMKDIVEANPQ